MATPKELISAVKRALEDSGRYENDMRYLVQEADTEGSDADTKLPATVIQTMSDVRLDPFNTDQVGVLTDDNGNHVGRVYHSRYRLDLQLDIWVAQDSSYDVDDLGDKMRNVLYNYDSAGPGAYLEDDQGQPIEEVWRVRLGDGERADNLSMTPSLRRWRQEITLWANEEFNTTEDYITTINYPSDSTMSGSGDSISG